MADDVLLAKAAIIERCVSRVREEYAGERANLSDDQTRQDAILLNLQRACEASIDAAMHLLRTRRLGVPQQSREAFEMLADAELIAPDLSKRMMRMVGFRNIAAHDYRKLDMAIVASIIEDRLDDFLELSAVLIEFATESV